MESKVNKRVFMNNGARLSDPDTTMSPAGVKDLFSAMYPELLNAEIQGPDMVNDELVYTFHRTTGTKGATPKRKRASVAHPEKSAFVRRLDTAAGETYDPSYVLPPEKLSKVLKLMRPIMSSPALSLPSSSFALFL